MNRFSEYRVMWMVFFFDLLYYWIAFSIKSPKKE